MATQPAGGRPRPIAVRYALRGDRLALAAGAYDRRLPLRIDPMLTYSSFLGGSTGDGAAIATDGSGNAYLAGYTIGFGFPVVNPYQGTPPGGGRNDDAVVSKFSADGGALVYSTYLGGGTLDDIAFGIAADAGGSATVVGSTASSDFPVAHTAQRTLGGQTDAFVARLGPAGNTLAYSTYWGGTDIDQAWAVALDGAGNAYVTGSTSSSDFPTFGPNNTTPYSTFGGGFVAEFAPTGVPTYSTCLPAEVETPLGSSVSAPNMGIAVDGAGDAYVIGTTLDGAPTLNPYQAAIAGAREAFVIEIAADGRSLLYGTYLGGGGNDYGQGIAVDCGGNIYVTGTTCSTNFPLKNAYQTRGPFQNGNVVYPVAFVAKLNPASGLVYSTYLGGTGGDRGNGIAVDGGGDAWVVGSSTSADFPQANPLPGSTAGPSVFVAELAPAGNSLLFSSNLGAVGPNYGLGIALDGAGNVYLTGATAGNFPTTAGAFQPIYRSGFEEGCVKIQEQP